MIAQECFPGLSMGAFSGNLLCIFLDGAFTHPNTQFEEFATYVDILAKCLHKCGYVSTHFFQKVST